ncbi:MAG: DmsC/YnfH family molybdoenzyme membrane anchor subunit [Polyangiales bacterium]
MPLVWMLVLTQLSVGSFVVEQIVQKTNAFGLSDASPYLSIVALVLGLIALGASTMHLGRPQYAWRAFLKVHVVVESRDPRFWSFLGCNDIRGCALAIANGIAKRIPRTCNRHSLRSVHQSFL